MSNTRNDDLDKIIELLQQKEYQDKIQPLLDELERHFKSLTIPKNDPLPFVDTLTALYRIVIELQLKLDIVGLEFHILYEILNAKDHPSNVTKLAAPPTLNYLMNLGLAFAARKDDVSPSLGRVGWVNDQSGASEHLAFLCALKAEAIINFVKVLSGDQELKSNLDDSAKDAYLRTVDNYILDWYSDKSVQKFLPIHTTDDDAIIIKHVQEYQRTLPQNTLDAKASQSGMFAAQKNDELKYDRQQNMENILDAIKKYKKSHKHIPWYIDKIASIISKQNDILKKDIKEMKKTYDLLKTEEFKNHFEIRVQNLLQSLKENYKILKHDPNPFIDNLYSLHQIIDEIIKKPDPYLKDCMLVAILNPSAPDKVSVINLRNQIQAGLSDKLKTELAYLLIGLSMAFEEQRKIFENEIAKRQISSDLAGLCQIYQDKDHMIKLCNDRASGLQEFVSIVLGASVDKIREEYTKESNKLEIFKKMTDQYLVHWYSGETLLTLMPQNVPDEAKEIHKLLQEFASFTQTKHELLFRPIRIIKGKTAQDHLELIRVAIEEYRDKRQGLPPYLQEIYTRIKGSYDPLNSPRPRVI